VQKKTVFDLLFKTIQEILVFDSWGKDLTATYLWFWLWASKKKRIRKLTVENNLIATIFYLNLKKQSNVKSCDSYGL